MYDNTSIKGTIVWVLVFFFAKRAPIVPVRRYPVLDCRLINEKTNMKTNSYSFLYLPLLFMFLSGKKRIVMLC